MRHIDYYRKDTWPNIPFLSSHHGHRMTSSDRHRTKKRIFFSSNFQIRFENRIKFSSGFQVRYAGFLREWVRLSLRCLPTHWLNTRHSLNFIELRRHTGYTSSLNFVVCRRPTCIKYMHNMLRYIKILHALNNMLYTNNVKKRFVSF